MSKSFNFLGGKKVNTKYFLVFSLVLISLFFAFNHHPPIIATFMFEGVHIYNYFLPTKSPPLIFSILEDPSTSGTLNNTFGYVALIVSRYVSDYMGHSLSNVRLPSVMYGLITLFLFYVIVNRWFNWKVALISTFLLSTNQYFLIFQHTLTPHMATLTTILFCIERFQNLLTKNNKFAILSFGFACALTTLHYWTGRWCMLGILFFYLVDFEKFSIWKYKSYLHFTNLKRIKTVLLVFLSMVIILTIFYPGNILLLFTPDFIYPSFRIGEYTLEVTKSFYNIFYNLGVFFKYYVFNRSNHPSDIMLYYGYPVENILILSLFLLGIIISLIRKITYPILFLLYILFITFLPQLFSEVIIIDDNLSTSTMNPARTFYLIPFTCIMAVLGFKYIYTYTTSRSYSTRPVFIFLIFLFFCFRIYGYHSEIKRFNTEIVDSYNIDFSQPAMADNIVNLDQDPHFPLRGHYDQVYFYKMAKLVSNHLKKATLDSDSTKLLFIPAEIYTPNRYTNFTGAKKGYPYYFPMYLTFYLQEQGINVSYLVKKKDVKETFLKKAVTVLDRYKQSNNLSPGDTLSAGHYPRTKKQEEIVKMFVNIIDWIENYERGKQWLDSIREQTHFTQNISSIGDYFVNVTSSKTPDYLIITSKEELDQIRDQSNYEFVLSLPL